MEMLIIDEADRFKPKTFAEVRDIFDKLEIAVRFFTSVRMAFSRLACWSLVLRRLQPVRSAPVRSTPRRLESERSVLVRSLSLKFQGSLVFGALPVKSRRCRFCGADFIVGNMGEGGQLARA